LNPFVLQEAQILSKENAPNLLKLLTSVLSIRISDGQLGCPNMLSAMGNLWSDECNRITVESVRSEPVMESRTQASRPRPRTSKLSSRMLEDDDLSPEDSNTGKHRIKCFGEEPNTLHIYSVIGNG